MKIKILFGSFVVVIIAALLFCVLRKTNTAPPNPPIAVGSAQKVRDDRIEEEQFVIEAIKKAIADANLPPEYVPTQEERDRIVAKARAKEMSPTEEELKIMFDTPFEFYGQVLDQFDNPVVGAEIRCTWGFHNPRSTPVELLSRAPDGKFEVLGHKTLLISVSVYPPSGYDETVKVSKNIGIAQTPARLLKKFDLKNATPEQLENFSPFWGRPEAYKGDKTKPMIFRLKKL